MARHSHYIEDIVGKINRFDERDMMFARQDLVRYFGKDSDQFTAYFSRYPDEEKFHLDLQGKVPLGGKNLSDAPMFRSQFKWLDEMGSDGDVEGVPASQKTIIEPSRASLKIKATAKIYGADKIGIGPLNQNWTYSHIGATAGNKPGYQPWGTPIDLSHHTSAISMGFKMDIDLLSSAPKFPTMLATAQAYAQSGWTAVRLADYIRLLGYNARAHHFSNYQVLCVPIAVDCGLGELSRAGYLITKEFGLAIRLSVVSTDMPLVHDDPVDIGVQSFCEQCMLCADQCPSGAIPHGDKIIHNGIKKWKLDEKKCYRYWHVNGTDCGICMKVCPWTKPPHVFHRIMAEFASKKGFHQKWMANADKFVYGVHQPKPNPDFLD